MSEPSRKPLLPEGWDNTEINDQPDSLFSLDDILINSDFSVTSSEDWDSVFTTSTTETSSVGINDILDMSAFNSQLINSQSMFKVKK